VRRGDVLSVVTVTLLFSAVCAAIGPFHPDRSFVAYRIAENVASGNGFVYNATGPPVEGYGSTAWLVVCAAVAQPDSRCPGPRGCFHSSRAW